MARINENYQKLQAGYLFPEIGRRTREFAAANPNTKLLRLGIGDITLPLVPVVVKAIQDAAAEMGQDDGVHGYGPEQGYEFLREAIQQHDFAERGVRVELDEIFVSDGSKQDSGNIQEIFGDDCRLLVTDPSYPVYVDTNVMAGRTGVANEAGHYAGIQYLAATEENGFTPSPPKEAADLIYLCSPNNPTGAVASRENLSEWVAYAREHHAVIIFDAAYDAFISDDSLPRSIYEIEGADECAIEMRSFSKRAGFTGVRCAYTVVPKKLMGQNAAGEEVSLNAMWSRRCCTKFNEVPYVIQRGAAAIFRPEGRKQSGEQVNYYLENARRIREGLSAASFSVFAGVHAPYIWMRTPAGLSSWEFFDQLLEQCQVIGTPGSGFGPAGEGYFRLSAFNSHENVEDAIARISKAFGR